MMAKIKNLTGRGLQKILFSCLLLLFTAGWLCAQGNERKAVAFLPFWGDNQDIVRGFGNEVYTGIGALEGYIPFRVDMNNLPRDVPPGGFPPYVCPSASMINRAPFAITGEIAVEPRTGQYRLRLYLWRMSNTRLIISDELAAYNQEECRDILPSILNWMFSQAQEELPVIDPGVRYQAIYITPTEPLKWLYLGLRTGGSMRIYSDLSDIPSDRNEMLFYDNLHVAFHVNFQFTSFLGLQLEAMYNHIFENQYEPASMMFPFMLRASYRLGSISLAAFGGGYYWMPIGDANYAPEGLEFGYTAGIMFGNRIGPGYLYLDIRWASDLTNHRHIDDGIGGSFRRSMFSIGIGYELGIIAK